MFIISNIVQIATLKLLSYYNQKSQSPVLSPTTVMNLLKGLKYCVFGNCVSKSQDNREETPPHTHKDPKWQAILPDLLAVKKSDLAQLEAKKKKLLQEVDVNGKKDAAKSDGNWLTKLSKKQKELTKRKYGKGEGETKVDTKRSKKSLLLKKGAYVYTRDRRIVLKSSIPHIGGQRCYRMGCRETIMKESMYYDRVRVVKFDNGRSFSCSEGLLHFISSSSTTHRLIKDANGKLTVEKISREFEDREAILDVILQTKSIVHLDTPTLLMTT